MGILTKQNSHRVEKLGKAFSQQCDFTVRASYALTITYGSKESLTTE